MPVIQAGKKGEQVKYDRLDERTKEDFGKYVRKLLKNSFISEEGDSDAYRYVKVNREAIDEYINVIGYELTSDDAGRVIGLRECEEDDAMQYSLKVRLKKYQTVMLFCIWQFYQDRVNSMCDADGYFFEIGDLEKAMDACNIRAIRPVEREETLKLFEGYGLIRVIGKDYGKAGTRVRMFPALKLCLETDEFDNLVKELGEGFALEGEENG